jgi:hypothetical protein
LLDDGAAPEALPPIVRRRVARRVATLVPVATTILGLSLKAVATTFAASVVVTGVTVVAVQQLTEATPPVSSAHPAVPPPEPRNPAMQGRSGSETPAEREGESTGPVPTGAFEAVPEQAAATPPPPTPPVPREVAAKDRLAREVDLLESARSSLGSMPAKALQSARRHERDFPDGQLRAERMFIEAQALKNLGRHAEARRQAERALRQYPKGLYA